MSKFTKLTKALGTAAILVGASSALAETVTVPASVTVNNAIDFTFTGELNFGEIRAIADGTDLTCASLALPANPASPIANVAIASDTICTAGEGDAVIQSVGGTPSRPEFSVAGVAPFTNLDLTLPTTITLAANLPAGSPSFTVGNFSAYRTSGTPGAISTGADNLATSSTGTVTFTVGAQLATHVGTITNTAYEDAIPYEGTFDVTVAY